MNKALLVMAGLLLVSTMVLADTRAEKTASRWDGIISTADFYLDKYYEMYKAETYKAATSFDFGAIKEKIAELRDLRSQLNVNDYRANQKKLIGEFNGTLEELKDMFNEINGSFPGFRGHVRV
ncbi:MAG: hypothetical protein HY392_02305 [Candidatus Diapherotrites archaeon]|nr:hypothetical protein [Candidatus Diapherotrites archaeon]